MILHRNLTVITLTLITLTFLSCGGSKGFSLAKSKERDLNSCLALAKKKKHEDAIECFEAYKSRHYGDPGAADAELAIADSYFAQKNYLVAAEAYNLFTESYPFHVRAPYAYYRAGVSYLKAAPKTVDRDQNRLDDALKNLEMVVLSYPGTPYAAEARDFYDAARYKMAKKHFYVGRFYYKTGEFLAAIPRFQTVITDYSELGLDDKSFYYLVTALKKTEQSELARQYFELYKKHYPDRMKAIKKMAGIF